MPGPTPTYWRGTSFRIEGEPMSDFIAFLWPLFIVIVVFFFIARLWVAFVDAAASGAKKMLGIKPKEVKWHTLGEGKEADKTKNEREDGAEESAPSKKPRV